MRTIVPLLLFAALMWNATAHPQGSPDLAQIARSDSVYLTKVTLIDPIQKKVTFSVVKVLRGEQHQSLMLTPGAGQPYKVGSSWILFRTGNRKEDIVGYAEEGDYQWIPISADPGASEGIASYQFSVKQIRDYLLGHPAQS